MLNKVLVTLTDKQLILAVIAFVVLGLGLLAYQRRTAQGSKFPWRKPALYVTLLVFVAIFLFGEPLFRAIVYAFYDVQDRVISTDLANIPANQVLADKVIGGWVQVGTLLSKLFAAISFYATSYILPWLLQRTTHPEPTRWAKEDYTAEFQQLLPSQRFEAYGRLQINQSIRFVGSVLAAALLV